jgi:hypothetical protein
MALPSELTRRIVEYLSPSDYARVAQVNKSWRQVVYSNTCWDLNKLWDVKHESRSEFYSGLEIPRYARHLGEPTHLCFHDWLFHITKSRHFTYIPLCVLESDNFELYVKYLQKVWRRLGCPCIHTNHHKWYDVYRGRSYLTKLSHADQQRVFYRLASFTKDRKIVDTNSYRFWLVHHIDKSHGFLINSSEILPPSDHPVDIIHAHVKNREHRRLLYLNEFRETLLHQFRSSIQNLRIYGKKEFDKKDLPWNELFSESTKEEAVGDDASNC